MSIPRVAIVLSIVALTLCAHTPPTHANNPDDRFWQPDTSLPAGHVLVEAIAFHQGSMYITGKFTDIAHSGVYHVARFDGSRWHLLGGGVGTREMGLVHRILIDNNRIYVAGCFSMVGGHMTVCNIAMWNGVMWNMMMGGTDRAVRAIALDASGNLYAGGEFTMAGHVPARGIAMWDGMMWHSPGGSVDNHVSSIAMYNNDVYVGGAFRMAGGVPANFVARWDGRMWHGLGEGLQVGVDNLVSALAVWQGSLFVGGMFRTAGGITVNGIARWDGRRWYALGRGVSGASQHAVREFYAEPNRLYVGGLFQYAGNTPAKCIAYWNGRTWSAMGSGTDYAVKAFGRAPDGTLWIGGDFSTVAGQPSRHLARWTRWDGAPAKITRFAAALEGAGVKLTWSATPTGAIDGFQVYRRVVGAPTETRITSQMLPPNATHYMDTRPPGATRVEYSLGVTLRNGGETRAETPSVRTPALSLALSQNSPNPFTPSTRIAFTLPQNENVRLDVFDVRGMRVATLVDGPRMAGMNSTAWNGRGRNGGRVHSGIYFYRLITPSGEITRKMIMVR